jgi:hypothetical protein
MIRLNRFNLGADPVATIDALLRNRLAGMLNGQRPHGLVAELAKRASEIEEGLKSGDYKLCKKTRSGPSASHVSGHQREIRLPPPLPGLQIERTLRGLPAQDSDDTPADSGKIGVHIGSAHTWVSRWRVWS